MTKNSKILIVDDDSDLRNFVRLSIDNGKRDIVEAKTALDGFTICRAIDDKPSLLLMKTVIITGHDAAEDINQAKRFGINAYLIKPFSPRTVVELVERLEPKRYEMLVVPAERHD